MQMSVLANFVENTFVQSRSAETLPVKNPAFDTVITSIPISLDEEVERAVESESGLSKPSGTQRRRKESAI